MTSKQYKVDEETAAQEFERLCRGRRVDTDVDSMTPKEKKDFSAMRAEIVRLIREGRLEVHEDGVLVTYRCFDGQSFTFKKAGGATFLALETHDPKQKIANLFEALADMSGVASKKFTALEEIADVKALSVLASLFFSPQ
jgi:poly-gamma-glutamate capsule biosynthesis protein CapA/YwtB (metallophosphatase superfamily)